jgi:acyl-CoA synthetase (AMP-forming)/AMP-acid ligase II
MIYGSHHPPLDIPPTPLADFVLARAAARGTRPALVDSVSGRTIAYAELPALVDAAAAALSRLGLGKGDVCAIFSPNVVEYPIAILAVARLGAIVTTASPLATKTDLLRQLEDSQARILITCTALRQTWSEAVPRSLVEHVFTFDPPDRDTSGTRWFGELLADQGTPPRVDIDPSDLVALPYSSGTTGLPKGVMLTHRNLVVNILQLDAAGHFVHDQDTAIAFLPFFHIYGFVVIAMLGLWAGATLVVMAKFELEPYLDLVAQHRATMLHVVPPVMVAFAKHPAVDRRDFSSIRVLFSGAAPLGADVIDNASAVSAALFSKVTA